MPRKSAANDWTEDDLILAARGQRKAIFARVLELATNGQPHVSVAASKLLIEWAAQETDDEADPVRSVMMAARLR